MLTRQKSARPSALVLVSLFFPLLTLFAQPLALPVQNQPPKQEIRAVWITTTAGLDWPKSTDRPQQQRSLREIVRRLASAHFNTIFFQARARGDAYYRSSFEPWAENLTGTMGKDPGWDPLDFLLNEAHAAGMEVHAWFNLYKVGVPSSLPQNSRLHVSQLHPKWVFTYEGEVWLDPGVPEVNRYLLQVAMDLVRRYDIDGIQFDFVRYPGKNISDGNNYRIHNRSLSLDDWRRSNITSFVRAFHDSVAGVKPMLKIGATPLGNFNGGKPAAHSELYQDAIGWAKGSLVDYLVPQIYWNIGSSSGDPDFSLLARLWAENGNGRQVVSGIGSYKPEVFREIPEEIDAARAAGCQGQAFFRYGSISDWRVFKDRYRTIAIIPAMPWKDSTPPEAPAHLAVTELAPNVYHLEWSNSSSSRGSAAKPRWYGVYRSGVAEIDFNDATNLVSILPATETSFIDSIQSPKSLQFYYAVSTLDRGNNESGPSPVATTVPKEVIALRDHLRGSMALAVSEPGQPDSPIFITYKLTQRTPVSIEIRSATGSSEEHSGLLPLVQETKEEGTHIIAIPASGLDAGKYVVRMESQEGVLEDPVEIR